MNGLRNHLYRNQKAEFPVIVVRDGQLDVAAVESGKESKEMPTKPSNSSDILERPQKALILKLKGEYPRSRNYMLNNMT